MSQANTGLFPACFQASRNNRGGETATFKWLINSMQRTISGTGQITQAINPPTNITVEMTGHYIEEDGGILVQAVGSLPGASIHVAMRLESWSGGGVALSLQWLANNHYFSDTDVPVKSIECFS